jgi:protein-disulfide isomerase
MTLTRRATLTIAGGAVAVGVIGYLGWRQFAPAPSSLLAPAPTPVAATPTVTLADQREAERSLGDRAAKVTVLEFFSLTCTHCAAFARETMPDVEKDLITPGKVRFVYHDFPLDQVALTAAMVARSLPAAQYYPFVTALFASQDRWAFARGINTTEEIWKLAALAGMARANFDKAVGDTDLRNWILQQQQADQDHWKIDATPSFVINGQKYSGEMSYEAFRKLLPEV